MDVERGKWGLKQEEMEELRKGWKNERKNEMKEGGWICVKEKGRRQHCRKTGRKRRVCISGRREGRKEIRKEGYSEEKKRQ